MFEFVINKKFREKDEVHALFIGNNSNIIVTLSNFYMNFISIQKEYIKNEKLECENKDSVTIKYNNGIYNQLPIKLNRLIEILRLLMYSYFKME